MNSSKRPLRGETPDTVPNQDDLPTDLDNQADRQVDSNGRTNGPVMVGNDATKPGTDPYNLTDLVLGQNFASALGVQKLVTTIPVKKPSKEWFVRTRLDQSYSIKTAVLELKEDSETYLVGKSLWPQLLTEPTFSPRLLVTTINRQGVLFLWPIRLPGADGKIDDWNRSALEAADEAKSRWVRLTANRSLGAYEILCAPGLVAEPEWPALSFQEIIRLAFKDRMIDDLNHPVLRRLRGEA
jgi:hypothetical protein